MTTPFPRRIKDLSIFTTDTENDFYTPKKTENRIAEAEVAPVLNAAPPANENKENDAEIDTNRPSTSSAMTVGNTFNSMRIPKRSSELMLLDSDDSDDEDGRSNNLNCAILNDSFILSPNDEHTHSRTDSSASLAKQTDISLLSKFDKLALRPNDAQAAQQTSPQVESEAAAEANCSRIPIIGGLETIEETNENKVATQQQSVIETETPMRGAGTLGKSNSAMPALPSISTTHTDAQFVTPQVQAYSVSRRPRTDLCSTQSQKSRAAIANEFRSQKVLFQTPMTIARAMPLPSDSISLSLCDTINEGLDTPNTAERTSSPAQRPAAQPNAKSKKSLEGAFIEAEQQDDIVIEPQKATSSSSVAEVVSSTSASCSSVTTLRINTTDYDIIKRLGCGGSSSVYLGRRKDNGHECALKVVDLHGDPVVVEGYLNETKLLAKLQGNACVVALFDYQLLQKESKLYMVMEKGDSDLNKILQTYTTKLPLYVLMNFLYQMLQAVNYIHQNGVIHSDLKPANFLMINGRLKLIDFGIASNIAIDSTSIIKFSQAGTFNYISPEALTDTSTGSSPMRSNQPKIKISTKSDVWSLGCILYLLLYQKTPFSHIKNIYAKISAISCPTTAINYPALPIYYPNMLVHMVTNCLQHNPKNRPSCADLMKYPFQMIIPIHNLSMSGNHKVF